MKAFCFALFVATLAVIAIACNNSDEPSTATRELVTARSAIPAEAVAPSTTESKKSPTKESAPAKSKAETLAASLSLDKKKAIYRDVLRAELEATKDADAQLPLEGKTGWNSVKANSDLAHKLEEQYKKRAYSKHGITEDVALVIAVEAVQQEWYLPIQSEVHKAVFGE